MSVLSLKPSGRFTHPEIVYWRRKVCTLGDCVYSALMTVEMIRSRLYVILVEGGL